MDQIENAINEIAFDDLRTVFELKANALLLAPSTDDVFFFNDIKQDLYVLNEDVFWEVMKFYSLLKSIEVYSHAVSAPVFATLSVDGKIGVVKNFSKKHEEALVQGKKVIELLNTA